MAAQALRAFSISHGTMAAYRSLGNLVGGKSRSKAIEPHYIHRADSNLKYVESVGAIRDGMTALELGTGWVHWEALFTRLFYDVRFYLFDVWDNRQFAGLQQYAGHLKNRLYEDVDRPREQLGRASCLLDKILDCSNFDELYSLLGFTYIVEPRGRLDVIPDDSVDLVISSDVLEHIPRAGLEQLVLDLKRVLRPGGVCVAQIVEEDHLRIYDRSVHPKNYLRYSEFAWKALFENRVQYINRLQHSDYVKLFAGGFELIDEQIVVSSDNLPFEVSQAFKGYSDKDLKAGVTRIAARAPL